MKKIIAFLCIISSAFAYAGDESIDSYTAQIGEKDHFNSKGVRLKSVADILRQDRANYHEYNLQDAGDEPSGLESFFASKANREKLPSMLKRGSITKATEKAILNGTPIISVTVYPKHIEVSLQ